MIQELTLENYSKSTLYQIQVGHIQPILLHDYNINYFNNNSKAFNDKNRFVFYYDGRTGDCIDDKKKFDNLEKLYNIEHLEQDWNGYGSKQIPRTVIIQSRNFIKNILIQPIIFPTGRQSIHMQYELEDKSYLEFEIFSDKITCMKVPKRIYSQATFEVFNKMDMGKFNKIIEEFYGIKNKRK